ncbi:MAG: DUF192 domain-containing protein [Deltaproteobacteria bacterium]|jgi:uncharacterized membrane protein (UPF0127 family)|nr:DUF192 domain-containing protein [Deltaproteobacteria bacterium]
MKIKYFICCILFILIPSFTATVKAESILIQIKDITITAEVANTPGKRRVGLMNRKSLEENTGMLFVFEKERYVKFWMKNTSIPLSIAYINKSGVIKEIHDLEPYSLKQVNSSYPVLYALEVNQGFFEKNDIKAGDSADIPLLK